MPSETAASRPKPLDHFLYATQAALRASAVAGSPVERAVERVFDRVRGGVGPESSAAPVTLPVVAHLPAALARTRGAGRIAVADALGAIAPGLRWTRRSLASPSDTAFWNGHANALILGPGGIEERADIWIGLTLMAPGVTYALHDHPPEEVYLRLAPGEWWNEDMDWTDPGETGLIYNRPGIRHAMRAGEAPFLALWVLPI